jgi:molecular chaperone HscB
MMNYFELYNLKTSFDLDLHELARTYQQLQQLTHPDKFAGASERDKRIAVQKNAQVNDAYQVLKTPLSRAEHILALRGLELQHEQQTIQDNAFLMQQMHWREELEELEQAEDQEAGLLALDEEIKALIEQQLEALHAHLTEDTESANQAAAILVRKLKFMYKIRQEIARKEDALNDL